jgi:hypothetical protein
MVFIVITVVSFLVIELLGTRVYLLEGIGKKPA